MPDHHIDPDRAVFDAFKALPRGTPVEMLNLLRFREGDYIPCKHDETVA